MAALPETDWRRTAPEFTGDRLDRTLRLVDVVRRVAERHGSVDGHRVGVAAVAIAWTLAWPGVTGAIVGARQPAQIDDWLAAAGLYLTPDDLDEIAGAIAATSAGGGPARPPVTVP